MDYPKAWSATNFDSDLGCRRLVGRLDAMTALSAAAAAQGVGAGARAAAGRPRQESKAQSAHLPADVLALSRGRHGNDTSSIGPSKFGVQPSGQEMRGLCAFVATAATT